MDTVTVDGVQFIKAAKAAKSAGYTADYVGQLCRGGKIESRLVGRTWYVRDGELEEHRRDKSRQNKSKTIQNVEKSIEEEKETKIHKTIYSPFHHRHLLNTHIQYSNDDTATFIAPSDPVLAQNTPQESPLETQDEETTPVPAQEIMEETVAHIPVRVTTTTEETQPPKTGVYTQHKPKRIRGNAHTVTTVAKEGIHSGQKIPAKKQPTSYAILSFPLLISVFAMLLLVGSLFLQNVWVYEVDEAHGEISSVKTNVTIASISVILEDILE